MLAGFFGKGSEAWRRPVAAPGRGAIAEQRVALEQVEGWVSHTARGQLRRARSRYPTRTSTKGAGAAVDPTPPRRWLQQRSGAEPRVRVRAQGPGHHDAHARPAAEADGLDQAGPRLIGAPVRSTWPGHCASHPISRHWRRFPVRPPCPCRAGNAVGWPVPLPGPVIALPVSPLAPPSPGR